MKEIFKRIFCLVLSILMIVGVFPFKFAFAEDFANSNKIVKESMNKEYFNEKYTPEAQEQIIKLGNTVFAIDSIKNKDKLPKLTKYYFLNPENEDVDKDDLYENPDQIFGDYKPDTSTSGEKEVKIVIVYQDGSIDLLQTKVIIKNEEEISSDIVSKEAKKEKEADLNEEKPLIQPRSIKPYEPVRNYKFVLKDAQGSLEKIISEQRLTSSGGFLYNPETPEKRGHKFLGWYINDEKLEFNKNNENDDLYLNIDSFEIQKDETVFVEAKYVKYHEVKFHLKNDNSDWEEVFETVAVSSTDLSPEDIPLQLKEGEKLEDWYYDEGLKNKVEEGNIKLEGESVNLYGKVIKGAWLYFDVGKFSHTVLEKQFLQDEITKKPEKTPKRFGYIFQHWSDKDKKDDKGEYIGEEFNFGEKLKKDTKLYAVWKKDTKVKYNIRKYTQLETDHKDLSIDKRNYKPYESEEELIEIKEGDNLEYKIIEKYLENFSNQDFKNDIKGFHLPIAENDKGNKKSITKVIEFKESDGFSPAELRVYYSRDTINIKFQDENGNEKTTFTGLYGQKISKYDYKWPKEIYRETTDKVNDNRRVTYLDVFNIDALNGVKTEIDKSDGKKSQTIILKKEVTLQKEDNIIHFYKEKLDEKGQYELSLMITSKNDQFTITDKYVGFTAAYYEKDEEQKKEVDKNGKPIEYRKTLKIYNIRKDYDLTFDNIADKKIEKVPYDKALDEYKEKYKNPVKPDNIPDKFIFGGWYNDSDFTNKVEWESKTMPAENMEVYAKWEPNQITINVYNKFDSKETVSTINTHKYGSYLNTGELPTVIQGDKVLYEGDKNIAPIQIPEGDIWDGWYTRDQKTDRYKKYDFREKLTDNLDFYPYYYSQGTVRAYYYKNKEDWAAKKDPILTSAPHKKNIIAVISGIDEDINSKLIGKFISWTDGQKRYFKGDNVIMDNNLYLYPIFDNNSTKTKLSYEPGEFGTGEEKIIELSNNETIILPGKLGEETVTVTDNVIFTANSGYQFDGWKNQTDGKIYKPGEKLLVDNKNDKENVLTAVWFPKPINITVEKKWQDHEGKEIPAPVEAIKVKLLRDGIELDREIELNAKNNWKGEFENLPNTSRLTGEKYSYTVKEVGENGLAVYLNGKWHTVIYAGTMKDGFIVTNKEKLSWTSLIPPTKDIKVIKLWKDHSGNTIIAPTDKITVELYKDAKPTGKKLELTKDNNWSGEFKNLEVANGIGSTAYCKYTVKEIGEDGNNVKIDGKQYKVVYGGNMKDGLTITNEREASPIQPIPNSNQPKTGDGTNLSIYILVILLSGFVLIQIGDSRKRCFK